MGGASAFAPASHTTPAAPMWLSRRLPSESDAELPPSILRALAEAFNSDRTTVEEFVPQPQLAEQFAQRGSEQWAYGELTAVGCRQMLDALLEPPLPPSGTEERFIDIGSGAGIVVLYSSLTGLRSVGLELVPARHAAAEAALRRLQPGFDSPLPLELLCADALATTAPYAQATRLFCNNAIWPDDLNAAMATHAGALRFLVHHHPSVDGPFLQEQFLTTICASLTQTRPPSMVIPGPSSFY